MNYDKLIKDLYDLYLKSIVVNIVVERVVEIVSIFYSSWSSKYLVEFAWKKVSTKLKTILKLFYVAIIKIFLQNFQYINFRVITVMKYIDLKVEFIENKL